MGDFIHNNGFRGRFIIHIWGWFFQITGFVGEIVYNFLGHVFQTRYLLLNLAETLTNFLCKPTLI